MKTQRFFLGLWLAGALAAQAEFDFITNNGGAIITGYTGPGGAVVIPSVLGGLPVTEIQGSGFEDRGLTSVAISASVTNIEAQEFAPNDSLTAFTVDSNNPAYSGSGGVLFNKNGTTLMEYPPGISGSYAIPTNVTSIGQSAFAAAYFLSGVTIPNSVTNIGAEGFGFCFDLTSVMIPASVTGIGPDTFINCYNLPAIDVAAGNSWFTSAGGVLFDKSETTLLQYPTGLNGTYAIPNGVTAIGVNAFVLCDGLTGVTMPASVASLADSAFGDCAGLTNIALGAGVSYISTSAFAGANNLTAINVDSANPNFSSLNGVVFNKTQTTLVRFPPGFNGGYTTPGSVTSIADDACEDCSLTDVMISSNVANIGLDSFQGCGSLTNVTISDGVQTIGEFAFGDCPKLASVTIPSSVATLPFGAFAYCGLNAVYFGGNAPMTEPMAFLGDSATVYYMAGTSGWTPTFDGMTTVIENAPTASGALQVTILPAGAVASGAQWQVDGGLLQPGGATVLGLSVGPHTVTFTTVNGWMAPTSQMVSVTVNATNAISGTYTQEAAPASDFTFSTNGASITITGYKGPGGVVEIPSAITGLPVTSIGAQAFNGASLLTAVTIPDSVTNLGQSAFVSCPELAAVTISQGVSEIAIGTFQDCFSLAAVTFRGAISSIDDDAFASCPSLTSLPIPDTVTNLGQYAFFGGGLTNVVIPARLTSIGEAAFLDCIHLPAIQVDPANPDYASVAGVLFNKNQTVLVAYPDGNPASSYTIPNGVLNIGDFAFEYCTLTNVIMPAGITNIGNYSFEICEFLTTITLPDSLISIGNGAFASCNGLTNIFFPASLTSLGTAPFASCMNLMAFTVALTNPVFGSASGVLYNKSVTTLVQFPGGRTGAFAVPAGVGDIGVAAFEQSQLLSVAIPRSVTNIELDAFFNCGNLTSVAFTDGLTSIGVSAFQDCYNLDSFVLPATLTNIGFSAFSSCNALTNVVIPSSVTTMGDYAFAFNSGLAAAYFEGNAPSNDASAFANDPGATIYYLLGATGWDSTFGTAPTALLPGISIAANPTNGAAPLTVKFYAMGVGRGNPVTNWNWNFGDGAVTAAQNPSHTYTTPGLFAAAVVETNSEGIPDAGGTVTITVTPSVPPAIAGASLAGANLVLDGSNGQSGQTYIVLMTTNLARPLNQWASVATNLLATNGNFSITVSNTVSARHSHRFYILQTQ